MELADRFPTHRMVGVWNKMPEVVETAKIPTFKKERDKHRQTGPAQVGTVAVLVKLGRKACFCAIWLSQRMKEFVGELDSREENMLPCVENNEICSQWTWCFPWLWCLTIMITVSKLRASHEIHWSEETFWQWILDLVIVLNSGGCTTGRMAGCYFNIVQFSSNM